jgi:nicotinamide-nucleotide amidase
MPTVEILSQGDEVVTGQIADTNAAWLATALTDLGYLVRWHTTVGDDLGDIRAAIDTAAGRADLVVSTGGLGPTQDDLTAEAVAAALGVDLVPDPIALAAIEAYYARHARPMPAVNRKQALLPAGAIRLDNDWGTAPGFAGRVGRAFAVFLPGVPREMKPMFRERVLPLLRGDLAARPGRLYTIRTTGVGESDLQQRLGTFAEPGVVLSYRTRPPENHVKLRFTHDYPEDSALALVRRVAGAIGGPVFCVEGVDPFVGDLERVVVERLLAAGHTVATAESCTGGALAASLTSVPGASGAFLEGVVCYSNAAKVRLVGVEPSVIQAHGAVSELVAGALASGVRARSGATYGLSTTGVAGPGGGTSEKPVGTVFVGLATPSGVHVRRSSFGGDRARIQALSVGVALDLLRLHLQGLPLEPSTRAR